jgi:DNA polymerase III sliding clamp (beta) subunit (PCNA family)
MLKALKFVQGAVAQKNHVPVLQHFRIHDGRIQSHNGVLTLSSPIDCDLTIQPLAKTFVHAITLCEETVALHETDTGRLAVTSGNFRAFIDTSAETFPEFEPGNTSVDAVGLLDAIRALAPIMSDDASRPWSRGILFVGNSAFVTNNIVLVEHWLKHPVSHPFGLPAVAVNELLRIGEEPERITVDKGRVTFHFDNDRWLMSTLLVVDKWPDVRDMLEHSRDDQLTEIGPSFFEALHKLKPFTKDLRPVYLNGSTISTSAEVGDGACIELHDTHYMQGTWALDQLMKLEGIAESITWGRYPKPCAFFGSVMRGIIIGIYNAHR